jgi:hypothetical protein
MSPVPPVSAHVSSAVSYTAGTSAPGAAPALGEAGSVPGALGVQTSLLLESAKGLGNVDALAALALALLLGKSSEAKNDDDPWKMLVAMAMLSGMSGGGASVSFTQNVSVSPAAYAPAQAAAGTSVNLQG